jgi:hypothetical protein
LRLSDLAVKENLDLWQPHLLLDKDKTNNPFAANNLAGLEVYIIYSILNFKPYEKLHH